jgi:hypothetical protein
VGAPEACRSRQLAGLGGGAHVEAVLAVLGAIGLLIAIAANLTRVAEIVEGRRRSRRAAPADGPAEDDR